MKSFNRVVCWFSAGAASAVAAKLAIEKYGEVVVYYCDTGGEHPDNERFKKDVENWLGVDIIELKSENYQSIDDVFERTRFLRGPNGARCTTEMKKKVRYTHQKPDDKHIFGYTYDESKRIVQILSENWDLNIECPLYDFKYKKEDCFKVIQEAGIELPIMYRLGFSNNNCIGCVKSESPYYWNNVRENFPDVFNRRAKQERDLGFALIRHRKKPVFLDELDPNLKSGKNEKINCDFLCSSEE